MCDCINRIDNKLKGRGYCLETTWFFSENNKLSPILKPNVGIKRLDGKKLTDRDLQGVNPTFCPFCGERYEEEAE